MLKFDANGIYCEQAGVYIDPWRGVDRAIITHAHSDHARWGSKHYLAHPITIPILRLRLGQHISTQALEYGEEIDMNGVKISLHPAGHIMGSAQVRLAYQGQVWVVSGDYKLQLDGLSAPFEPIRCHHFITESTFGLPIYRFPQPAAVHADINDWCATNHSEGKSSIVIGYSLGKAQRLLHHLDQAIAPIYVHGAVANINDALASVGFDFSYAQSVTSSTAKGDTKSAIVVAPPSVIGNPWLRRFEPYSVGIASGWMMLRGPRRREGVDRGFALSDHCDWQQLHDAIIATGAENIYVTHGYKSLYAQYLREVLHLNAHEVDTLYTGESLDGDKAEEKEETPVTAP